VVRLLEDIIEATESRDIERVKSVLAERREISLTEALRVVRAQREGAPRETEAAPA